MKYIKMGIGWVVFSPFIIVASAGIMVLTGMVMFGRWCWGSKSDFI